MMNCQEATRLLSQKLDRPLSLKEKMTLRFHLLICEGCHHYKQQMHQLRDITHTYVKHIPPHEDKNTDQR